MDECGVSTVIDRGTEGPVPVSKHTPRTPQHHAKHNTGLPSQRRAHHHNTHHIMHHTVHTTSRYTYLPLAGNIHHITRTKNNALAPLLQYVYNCMDNTLRERE